MPSGDRGRRSASTARRARLLLIFLVTGVYGGLLVANIGVNGSRYWIWLWRTDSVPRGRLIVTMALAMAPLVAALLLRMRWRVLWPMVLIAACMSNFGLQLAEVSSLQERFTLDRVGDIVRSDAATSYYSDAARLDHSGIGVIEFLKTFPQQMPTLGGHNRNKPPGPTLYYWFFIKLLGDSARTPLIAGLALGALASLTAAATYLLCHGLGLDRESALIAACVWALFPGPVVFLPELDQIYGLFTCGIVGLWAAGLRRDRPIYAAASGVLFAAGCFFTHALLVLTFFLAAYGGYIALRDTTRGFRRLLIHGTLLFTAFIGFYVILWLICRFDPIATFQAVRASQRNNLAYLMRDWPHTIGWDLLDFTLTAGWLTCVIAILGLALRGAAGQFTDSFWLPAIVITQIALIGITGVLQSEVARLWIFVLPLLAASAAIELRQWSPGLRASVWACMWVLLLAIAQNLLFIQL